MSFSEGYLVMGRACLSMAATRTQGALCHQAPHPLRLCTSLCAQGRTCTPWGKGCRFSGFLEGSWERGGGSGLCHRAQDKCKGQSSRPLACRRCPSHRSEPAVEEQSRPRSPARGSGCGVRWGRLLRGSTRNGSAYHGLESGELYPARLSPCRNVTE